MKTMYKITEKPDGSFIVSYRRSKWGLWKLVSEGGEPRVFTAIEEVHNYIRKSRKRYEK